MNRGWGVAFETNAVLRKLATKDAWDAGAIFDVGDPTCFEAEITFKDESLPLIVGITKVGTIATMKERPGKDDDLPKLFVRANSSSCFVFVDDDQSAHILDYDGGNPNVLARMPGLRKINFKLTVRFDNGQVSFISGGQSSPPCPVPIQEYRPCIFLHESHSRVTVSVSRKRPASQESFGSRLWKARRHTDATLKCGASEVHVHKDVLSTASPVFERMWSGNYKEAGEGQVDISDVPFDVVEAMVQFMYTGEIPVNGNTSQLYGAAKKYGLDDLADEVGLRLVDKIDADNMLERAKVLRLHASAGDAQASKLWGQLYGRIQQNPLLLQGFVEALLP